jgi:hypothetical protein
MVTDDFGKEFLMGIANKQTCDCFFPQGDLSHPKDLQAKSKATFKAEFFEDSKELTLQVWIMARSSGMLKRTTGFSEIYQQRKRLNMSINKGRYFFWTCTTITVLLTVYYYIGVRDLKGLRNEMNRFEEELVMINHDFETKTDAFKILEDDAILKDSCVMRNVSLRRFLLSNSGISQDLFVYQGKQESRMENFKDQLDVLSSRGSVIVALILISISACLLVNYRLGKLKTTNNL